MPLRTGSVQVRDASGEDRYDPPAEHRIPDGDPSAWLSADNLFSGGWLASSRTRNVVYALLIGELALLVGFVALYRPFDLQIYLWGGREVLHGLRLYDVKAHANWFTYPPFAAAVFTPLTFVPGFIVRLCWELGSVVALAWACVLTLRLAGYRPGRMVVLAMVAAGFVLEPMYHTLYLGQVNIFLFALVLIDMWRVSQGRTAGLGVGLATAIKLTPGIFVLLFLLTRRWKDALVSAITFVVCGVIGYLVDPAASRLYWTKLFYDTKRVSVPYISNQSVYAAVVRILGGIGHVGLWPDLVSIVLGAAGLALAVTLARRQDWLGATAVTGVTGLLVSPVSWTHHWVWVLPALVVLLRGGKGARIAAACGYLLFVLAPNWFTPHTNSDGQFGFHGVVTLVANCFMLAGLAFLGYVAARAYLPRRTGLTDELLPESEDQAWNLSWMPADSHARRILVRMTALLRRPVGVIRAASSGERPPEPSRP